MESCHDDPCINVVLRTCVPDQGYDCVMPSSDVVPNHRDGTGVCVCGGGEGAHGGGGGGAKGGRRGYGSMMSRLILSHLCSRGV